MDYVMADILKKEQEENERFRKLLKTIRSMQFDKGNCENVITKMIDKELNNTKK